MAGLASGYTRNHQLRQMVGQQAVWTQLEAFAKQVHNSLNPTEVAYHVANEGRRLIECDRLCVGVRHGRKATVEAVSGADVWAVGYTGSGSGAQQTLTEHWNGSKWSIVDSPNANSQVNHLYGVAAVSTNDVWAVGSIRAGSSSQTLVQHWDGASWQTVPSPNPGTAGNPARASPAPTSWPDDGR